MITKKQFERQYIQRSGISRESLNKYGRAARPCYCDFEGCEGWQMVNVVYWEEDERLWQACWGPRP